LKITTVSVNILYTEESVDEINKLLNSKEYYITPEGEIAYSVKNDVLELVLAHMTE